MTRKKNSNSENKVHSGTVFDYQPLTNGNSAKFQTGYHIFWVTFTFRDRKRVWVFLFYFFWHSWDSNIESLNTFLNILNNITYFFTYFFTHIYIKSTQTPLLNTPLLKFFSALPFPECHNCLSAPSECLCLRGLLFPTSQLTLKSKSHYFSLSKWILFSTIFTAT